MGLCRIDLPALLDRIEKEMPKAMPESKLGGPASARAPDTENCSAIE